MHAHAHHFPWQPLPAKGNIWAQNMLRIFLGLDNPRSSIWAQNNLKTFELFWAETCHHSQSEGSNHFLACSESKHLKCFWNILGLNTTPNGLAGLKNILNIFWVQIPFCWQWTECTLSSSATVMTILSLYTHHIWSIFSNSFGYGGPAYLFIYINQVSTTSITNI